MITDKAIRVIELRNYLIKPGQRDQFIEYFENHFINSQEKLEGYPLGQFRIKEKDNRFFWIRGFSDMNIRSTFLPLFYGGEVWKQYGPAANAMMLQWHRVHLLKPLNGIAHSNDFAGKDTFVTIDYYTAVEGQLEKLIDIFQTDYIPFLKACGIINISLWITEMNENDFPQLPVIQNKSMLIAVTSFTDESSYDLKIKQTHFSSFGTKSHMQECIALKETMFLYPTLATITTTDHGKV